MNATFARHLRAILILPVMVTVVIPGGLLYGSASLRPAWGLAAPLDLLVYATGGLLIAGGLSVMSATIRVFAARGRGTLAPWDPTQRLVVEGVYRHVRNPMISGVFGVLLGEAALVGLVPVLMWTMAFIAGNLVYIPLSEEPGLRRRFGADYLAYAQHVPRWIPRRTPWTADAAPD